MQILRPWVLPSDITANPNMAARFGRVVHWISIIFGALAILGTALAGVATYANFLDNKEKLRLWDKRHPVVYYEVKAPDGQKYSITGPSGATREQAISEAAREFQNTSFPPSEIDYSNDWQRARTFNGADDLRPYEYDYNFWEFPLLLIFVAIAGAITVIAGRAIRYVLSGE